MIFASLFSQLTRSKLLLPGIEEEQSLREQGSGVGLVTLRTENWTLKPKPSRLRTDIDSCECGAFLPGAWDCAKITDQGNETGIEVDTSLLS